MKSRNLSESTCNLSESAWNLDRLKINIELGNFREMKKEWMMNNQIKIWCNCEHGRVCALMFSLYNV